MEKENTAKQQSFLTIRRVCYMNKPHDIQIEIEGIAKINMKLEDYAMVVSGMAHWPVEVEVYKNDPENLQ